VISNPPPAYELRKLLSYVCGPRGFSNILNLCSPMEMDDFVRDTLNFALRVKFSKNCVSCNGFRTYCVGTFGNYTVWRVRKIRSGKHQHPPYYFSSKHVLTVSSASVCVTILQKRTPCISFKTSVKKEEGKLPFDVLPLFINNER